jgi:uncharacterized protein YdaU (DUF1376 family)
LDFYTKFQDGDAVSVKLPYFKLFPNDYFTRIRGLNNEEIGAYTVIVLQMWDSGPMSPEAVQSYVGDMPAKVLARFPINAGGNHYCPWLEDMREETEKLRKSFAVRGKKGADSRWGAESAQAPDTVTA